MPEPKVTLRPAADRTASEAGTFGFAAGVAWSVGMSMAQDAATPVWLRFPVFVGLAAVTLTWVGRWRA